MRNHSERDREIAAERHWAMSRRRFLRGVGACVALPALPSLLPALVRPRKRPEVAAKAASAAADGVRHHSQWREPGQVVAEGRRQELRTRSHDGAARRRQGADSSHLRIGSHQRDGRRRWGRRSCAGQRVAADRVPGEENGRRRYPSWPVDRPGGGPAYGPLVAISIARTDVRNESPLGQLR